jgi:hypothetical protein
VRVVAPRAHSSIARSEATGPRRTPDPDRSAARLVVVRRPAPLFLRAREPLGPGPCAPPPTWVPGRLARPRKGEIGPRRYERPTRTRSSGVRAEVCAGGLRDRPRPLRCASSSSSASGTAMTRKR